MHSSPDNRTDAPVADLPGSPGFARIPDELRRDLERRWARLAGEHPAVAGAVAAAADLAGQLPGVWASSEFVAETCLRHADEFAGLCASGRLSAPWTGGDLAEAGRGLLEGIEDEAGAMAALRGFRRREMLRIAWRDLAGLASLEETLGHLSELEMDVLPTWALS